MIYAMKQAFEDCQFQWTMLGFCQPIVVLNLLEAFDLWRFHVPPVTFVSY
jgi:hypothetical protein